MAEANDINKLNQRMWLDTISESSLSAMQTLSDMKLCRAKVDDMDESSDDDNEILFSTQAANSTVTSSMAFLEDR